MYSIPVLTPEQAKQWDARAEAAGLPLALLMEAAGRAASVVLAARFPERLRLGVLLVCGPGNNGGDGWVVARALLAAGVTVSVAATEAPKTDPARVAARLALEAGVRQVEPDGPWPNVGLVVDALLGTGATGPPRGAVDALLSRVAELALPVVALDGPTGLDLNDGVQYGPLAAALTLTFGGYRRGQLLARDEVGDLVVLDIGLPSPDPSWPILLTEPYAAEWVPPLAARAHKGQRGRIVVVGGDEGLLGAARLAARAAFAAGAGQVHLVAPAGSAAVVATAEPDLMTSVQPFEARPSARTVALLGRADAVVIGPGLGRGASRAEFVLDVLGGLGESTAILLDADALTAFAGQAERLREPLAGRAALLTPHAGEFGALFPDLAPRAGVDPWGAALAAAQRLGAAVLLKGVPTVVAGGRSQATGGTWGSPLTVAAGNPGLATGGSGDTLSGLAATLTAQGVDPQLAGAVASYALGEAADLAARRVTARSMRPMDVLAALPDVWRHWDLVRRRPPPPRPPILHELPAPALV